MSDFKMRSRKNETKAPDFEVEKLKKPDEGQSLEFLESKVVGIRLGKSEPIPAAQQEHKGALLALLDPERSEDAGCPGHWTHIPMLPPKGSHADIADERGPRRYRVALFGRWYIVRFAPSVSETHIEVAGADGKRRAFADLSELYRWAWAETYATGLRYREVN